MYQATVTFKNNKPFTIPKLDSLFIWDNLIIEKRVSLNWLGKIIRRIPFVLDFFNIFSSPVV